MTRRTPTIGILLIIALALPISCMRASIDAQPGSASAETGFLPLIVTSAPSPTIAPTGTPRASATAIPPTATATTGPTATATPPAGGAVLETFDGAPATWQVQTRLQSGTVAQVAGGSVGTAAQLSTTAAQAQAYLHHPFAEPAGAHQWEERPGTWYWQHASVRLPSATLAQLGPAEYLTLGGLWPSSGGTFGWFLRVRQSGALSVLGYTADGTPAEFQLYGSFPTDRWVELELGLHTQAGPGVKRAFAVVVDGSFYGWYRQGHMAAETYDRAALGVIDTNSADQLTVQVDQWRVPTTAPFPGGPDARPTSALQTHNFRDGSGAGVQYDWSTWQYAPTLDTQHGLFSATNRVQAGRNLDRMPSLAAGWAEIEVDWAAGQPNPKPDSYFGPMVGFAKEINREENLEVIPIGGGDGSVMLVLEAWIGNPVRLAEWPMPQASIGGTAIPEPGDTIRVRWSPHSSTQLEIHVSYYDSSAATWHVDCIQGIFDVSQIDDSDGSTDAVNFMDGFHTMSSVTIDSPQYSIRRYTVGTAATAPLN